MKRILLFICLLTTCFLANGQKVNSDVTSLGTSVIIGPNESGFGLNITNDLKYKKDTNSKFKNYLLGIPLETSFHVNTLNNPSYERYNMFKVSLGLLYFNFYDKEENKLRLTVGLCGASFFSKTLFAPKSTDILGLQSSGLSTGYFNFSIWGGAKENHRNFKINLSYYYSPGVLADGYQQNSIFSQLSNTNLNFDPNNVQVMKGHFIELGFQFSIYE